MYQGAANGGTMLDNIDVAILTKLNELAERHSLKPYDFVATMGPDSETGKTILRFEIPAQGNALREQRYEKMLGDLGVNSDGVLKGSDIEIIDALDHSLQLAPKPRLSF